MNYCRHGTLIQIVEAQNPHRAIDGAFRIAPHHHPTFRRSKTAVHIDAAGAGAGRHTHGTQAAVGLPNGACNAVRQIFNVLPHHG
jgi:hypothetical protein